MANSDLYLFNPTCELAVANGSFSYMPPLLLQQMENDLSALPFLLTNENDFVLTNEKPSGEFTDKLSVSGFKIPAFKNLSELENLETTKLGAIRPWGWSPATHYKLRNIKEKCSSNFKNSPVFNWLPEHRLLYERGTALSLLNKLTDEQPSGFFIDKDMTGKKITDIEEINRLLQKHQAVVVKAPISSSGRGIQIIRRNTLNQPNREWISGILKQQKYVIAEPWLNKLTDLSFQFYIGPSGAIRYLGHTVFETNSSGQYQSTLVRPDLKKLFSDVDESELNELISTTAEKLQLTLNDSIYSRVYEGFLGVDSVIFAHHNKLKIQPCIEINCRLNMGVMAMFCERQIHPLASGKFSIFFLKVS